MVLNLQVQPAIDKVKQFNYLEQISSTGNIDDQEINLDRVMYQEIHLHINIETCSGQRNLARECCEVTKERSDLNC